MVFPGGEIITLVLVHLITISLSSSPSPLTIQGIGRV